MILVLEFAKEGRSVKNAHSCLQSIDGSMFAMILMNPRS
jgi:hypothetical protein